MKKLFLALCVLSGMVFADAKVDNGGLSPKEALSYMETNKDVVKIEVTPTKYKLKENFDGSKWIPINELENRLNEVPKDKKVMLYCPAGFASSDAYKLLKSKNYDTKNIHYISGKPLVKEYNQWSKTQN